MLLLYTNKAVFCMNMNQMASFKSKELPDYFQKQHNEKYHLQYIFLINKVSKTKVDRPQRWKYTLVVAVQLYLTAYSLFI